MARIVSTTNPQAYSASASSRSMSYTNANGAGSVGRATATSPTGQRVSKQSQIFTPGATSSQTSSLAVATSDQASASTNSLTDVDTIDQDSDLHTHVVFHIGNDDNNVFTSTNGQDVMAGYGGVDIFQLSHNQDSPILDIHRADIITDFDNDKDYLKLSDGMTIDGLTVEAIDFDNDTVTESTMVRSGKDGPILAILLNTKLNTKLDNGSTETNNSLNTTQKATSDVLLGTPIKNILASDSNDDLLIGASHAETITLNSTPVESLSLSDINIGEVTLGSGNKIQLDADIYTGPTLEAIDRVINGMTESISLPLKNSGTLAIVQETGDTIGNSLLTAYAFISS